MIGVFETHKAARFPDGCSASRVKKVSRPLNSANIEILLEGSVEAFFKQSAKMFNTVKAVIGNFFGRELLVKIFLNKIGNSRHKIKLIGDRGGTVFLKALPYHYRVKYDQLSHDRNLPAIISFGGCFNDSVKTTAQLCTIVFITRNIVFKA